MGRYPTSAEAWGRLGEAYHGIGQLEPASIAFREATRYAPGSARAWLGLATSLFWLHKGADALAPAREAVRLAPENACARLCLERVLTALDRPLEAVAELEEAARLAPGWDAALGDRGLAQYRVGRCRTKPENAWPTLVLSARRVRSQLPHVVGPADTYLVQGADGQGG